MPTTSSSDVLATPDRWRLLLNRWRDDPRGSYTTWFLWEERLKNFRSIRRGIQAVVADIEAATFGNVYKGSSLETVVASVAEQRQIFRGADHAFLWKPKLRIPDIYENRENQLGFARFLHTCACCSEEGQIIEAIHRLNGLRIKGLVSWRGSRSDWRSSRRSTSSTLRPGTKRSWRFTRSRRVSRLPLASARRRPRRVPSSLAVSG
jgi:hypothetical protein